MNTRPTAAKPSSHAATPPSARRAQARKRAQQRRRPRVSRLLAWLLAAWFGAPVLSFAQVAPGTLPSGGKVVVGNAQVVQGKNLLLIQQGSNRLGMDWQSFNIGSGATVEFRQPDASSVALNRVLSNDATQIYGNLKANGQVFLTNPNGILFAPGSKVDVGGLVASTLDLSQQDFAEGRYQFNARAGSNGAVVNQGSLQATAGGYLALFGNRVANEGDISVATGSVVLASGRAATVSISGNGLISAVVAPGSSAGSVSNSGSITADGGSVTLTAQSATDIAASLVNNSGIIRANTLVERNGEIWIAGDQVATSGTISADAAHGANAGRISIQGKMQGGSVSVAGSISARSLDGSGAGGSVETSAAQVSVQPDARVDTRGAEGRHGTWTIDPLDFTVSAGGGASTSTGIGADTLATNLNLGNVTLATVSASGSEPGDIHVQAPVSWSGNTTLTLTATRNININASITASGDAGSLTLNPGASGTYSLNNGAQVTLPGSKAQFRVGNTNYSIVRTLAELQAIDTNNTTRSGNYALLGDLDASASSALNAGLGFDPIGANTSFGSNDSFRGQFDGLGHSISGLVVNRPTATYVGLFGVTHDARIRNLTLSGGSFTGLYNVGALVGYAVTNAAGGSTLITNVRSSAAVTAATQNGTWAYVGGLVGRFDGNTTGQISRSSSSGAVSSDSTYTVQGGLVGQLDRGSIDNSGNSGPISTSNTTGTHYLGGLVGYMGGAGTISTVTASGNVTGGNYTGGLVGQHAGSGAVSGATVSGSVTGGAYAGGLIGYSSAGAAISNATASSSATVQGDSYTGGLVGYMSGGSLDNSSGAGAVSGNSYVGGLVGYLASGSVSGGTATGAVTGLKDGTNTVYLGGVAGYTSSSSVGTSTASGNVTSAAPYGHAGGLVGLATSSSITGSTASGNVLFTDATNSSRGGGGLVGYANGNASISQSSATGSVTGAYYGGGLAGYFSSSNGGIANSNASGAVTVPQDNGYAGGLVGYFDGTTGLNTVRASGPVTGGQYSGGLVGQLYSSGGVVDSRATGAVTGGQYAGGLAGFAYNSGALDNSTATGHVSGTRFVGGLVGDLQYTDVTRSTAGGNVQAVGDSTVYAGGLVGRYYNYNNAPQIADSNAGGTVFADGPAAYAGGLVGLYQSNAGIIKSSNATGASITARDSANAGNSSFYTGGLVGSFSGGAISDSRASGAVSGRSYTGGLVGYVDQRTTMTNVQATGDVSGTDYVGGLVGLMYYTTIANGTATGSVTASDSSYAGGLVGYAYSSSDTSSISSSSATGSVTGGIAVGGLVGYWTNGNPSTNNAGIFDSRASGNVQATYASGGSAMAGGLVGYYNSSNGSATADQGIRRSVATGSVNSTSYAGGLVGYFDSTGGIHDSAAYGNIGITLPAGGGSGFGGGLVGFFQQRSTLAAGDNLINGSYAVGNVSLANGQTLSSFTDVYLGGLVGRLRGVTATTLTVSDAYATGSVRLVTTSGGRLRGGGLLGIAEGNIRNTYATGAVTVAGGTTLFQGGLAGATSNSSTAAANSYWATDSTGQASSGFSSGSATALGKTSAQLLSAATFSGWDIATSAGSSALWRQYDGLSRPLLRSFLTPATISLADVSKTYDGTNSLAGATVNAGALTHPERILVSSGAVDAGSYSLTAANLYSVHNGYDLNLTGTATLTINRRVLTLGGLAADKVYDGSTTASVGAASALVGLVAGEDLVFQPGGDFAMSFADKNAGAAKTVNISGSYTWTDGTRGKAANYVLPSGSSTTASITPATLTGATFSATPRAYDGTTTVAVTATGSTLSGVIGSDSVALDTAAIATGTLADKHAGAAKPVTVSGTALTGADAGNYTLAGIGGVKVDIAPRTATVNGIVAANRVYNTGTGISVDTTPATLSGVLAGDQVQVRDASVFGNTADKNVGNAKPVTISGLALRGPDATDYTPVAGPVSVNITPYQLTLYAGRTGSTDRVYDGTANAAITMPQYWYSGDAITVSYTSALYSDKNVAYSGSTPTSKTITVSGLAISGADAGNYTLLNTTATTSGTITPKSLSVTGVSAVDRVYDGSRNVVVNLAGATVDTSGVIAGDTVSVSTPGTGSVTGQMADKNVGSNKAVTVPGLTLTGADAGNYTLSGAGSGVTVNITRKDLTAVYTAVDKVYDNTAHARLNVTSADIVSGDSVFFYADQSYCYGCGYAYFLAPGGSAGTNAATSRHVGTGLTVDVRFNGMYGGDANNYNLLNSTGSATASITPKPVTLAVTGVNRVYDGTTAATVTLNKGGSGIYSQDTVDISYDAAFTGVGAKNVGTGKAVTASNLVLSGANAGNYTVANSSAATTASITAKAVTLTGITATDRAYDGTTVVAVSGSTITSAGFVAGDNVTVVPPAGGLSSGTIANKNVGNAKPVTVTGLTLSGSDAGNYSIDAAGSGITVNITPKGLTPSYTGVSRVYNGGVLAQVTPSTAGIVSGDVVTFTQQAVFTGLDAKDVGANKPVSVTNISISGAQAANYSLLATSASTTAAITPKPVTVDYTGVARVYNGLADVSASVSGNSLQLIAGDNVGFTQTARFTGDGSAGTGKAVSITGITLTGAQAGNYSLNSTTASTTADITPRPLGVSGVSAVNRVYDGTTQVTLNVAGASVDTSSIVAADVGHVSISLPPSGITTGSLADRHVGNGKAVVSISGLSIGGDAGANYTLVGASGLTANITPRSLTATYTGVNKVYNGSAAASVNASSGDILAVDAGLVGISVSGSFSGGKNVGVGKEVLVSGGFLTGSGRDDYTLLNPSGTTSASITPRALTASLSGQSKVYDGTVAAPVGGSFSGTQVVSGDIVNLAVAAEFTGANAKNVGTGKPISVTSVALTGADAGNYTVSAGSGAVTGSITPKPITVAGLNSVVANDRVYDGTRNVTVTVPSGVTLVPQSGDIVSGDTVTIDVPVSGITSGTVANKNVGTGKLVNVNGLTLSGTDAGNYSIAGTSGITVNITPRPLTAAYSGVNKVYDSTNAAQVTGSSSDILAGDAVLIRGNGIFTAGKNVGTGLAIQVQTAQLSSSDAGNYALVNTTGSASADITPRTVTPTYTGQSRVYDGSTSAPVTSTTSGFYAGDNVALTQTAVFTGGKNVGADKAIAISGISLGGSDAANYSLGGVTTASTSGAITPKPVHIVGLSGVSAVDRAYDGTTQVAVNVATTGVISVDSADIVGGDTVSVTPLSSGSTTGTVANKHVGSNKAVTVTGLALSGADAGNYTINATDGVTVNITPRPLTAVYSGGTRVYDGSTAATVTGSSADLIAGDTVSIGGSGVFTGAGAKNVGNGKPISVVSGTLGGVDAGDYTLLNPTGSATGSITPKPLSPSYAGGTKVYDGTVTAPLASSLAGLVSGDDVNVTETAVFTGAGAKNVGDNKAVSISGITLSGADAANYSLLGTTASTTASITPKSLRIDGLTGVSAVDRVYDGTKTVQVNVGTTGTVTPNSADLIPGDVVTVNAPASGLTTGTMLDKSVGNAKPVAVAGLTLGGADAGNYSVTATSGVTVNITPRPVTASYAGVNKIYDGSASATVNGSSADFIAGDLVGVGGTALFAAGKNAGTGLTVNVTGGALTGSDAANYSLVNTTGSTSANILARTVDLSFAGTSKVYDGTASASVTASVANRVAGDDLGVSLSAVYAGAGAKNVGAGKTIDVSGLALTGADAANYTLGGTTSGSTSGSITPRPVNVTGLTGLSAVDRVYDGTRNVQILVSGSVGTGSADFIAGDDVSVVPPGGVTGGTMADKSAGRNKAVVVNGLTLTGADAGNYSISGTAGVTVNIAPKSVSLAGISAVNRSYDGSTVVAVNTSGGSVSGVIAGDDVTLLASGVTGSMADKHAGNGKAVAVTGLALGGSDAGNYAVGGSGALTVDIAPRTLQVTATVADRVYNGSTAATAVLADNRISGDTLTLSAGSTVYDRKDAGSRSVSIGGLTLGGADAADYVLSASSLSAPATILPAPLSITARSQVKMYGETLALTGSEFNADGLASYETIGKVTLASAGTVATAAVTSSPYAITAGSAEGGTFDPANYSITYKSGTLTVTPRPVTVTATTVVRFADEDQAKISFGYSVGGSGLLAGDALTASVVPPAGSETAQGGTVRLLQPQGARITLGTPENYALSTAPGLLIVLPRPPRPGDAQGSVGNEEGEQQLALNVDPRQISSTAEELGRIANALAGAGRPAPQGLRNVPPTGQRGGGTEPTAAEINALLSGDNTRVTLPALQRMPLISFDPALRRVILGNDAARSTP